MLAGYRITGEVPTLSLDTTRRVVFDITMESQLNGYEGETMSLEVPAEANVLEVHETVKALVLRRVNQQVGVGNGDLFKADQIIDHTDDPTLMIPSSTLPDDLPNALNEPVDAPKKGLWPFR